MQQMHRIVIVQNHMHGLQRFLCQTSLVLKMPEGASASSVHSNMSTLDEPIMIIGHEVDWPNITIYPELKPVLPPDIVPGILVHIYT